MPSSPQDLVRRLAAAGRAGAQAFRGEERASTPPGTTPKASPVQAPTPTASDATTRASAPTRAPETDVRVAATTSPRLAELLAPEWDQTTLDRRTWRTDLAQAEMVLLESAGGEVVGWLGADAELTGVVEQAVAQGIPVLVWLTAGPVPDTGWLRAATAVGAVTGSLRDQAATMLGRDVVGGALDRDLVLGLPPRPPPGAWAGRRPRAPSPVARRRCAPRASCWRA